MPRPMLPEVTVVTGTETIVVRQEGKPFRALLSRIIASLVKAKRIERYTATTNAQGVATFIFSPAFTKIDNIQIITGWVGEQYVGGGVASQTLAGCTVQVMVSRGALVLSTGPFQKAGVGVPLTICVIGD